QCTIEEIGEVTARLAAAREAAGDEARLAPDDPAFSVKLTPIVAPTAEAMAEVAACGVTEVITVPWFFFGGDPNDPAAQDEAVDRFAAEVIEPLS
ncbi:MAG TPA: hypothetical protein VF228_16255, partial [Iamia sp.]